jgi:hypothetical protein
MTIADGARERVVQVSRGLPHYTHLLGLHSGLAAVAAKRAQVGLDDVGAAVGRAVQKAHQEISAAYGRAVWSAEKTAKENVLLACALADVDEHGYFAPADVRVPMSQLGGEKRHPRGLVNDLNQFASEARGAILQRTGVGRSFRYRFRDPLLQPYVVLRGVSSGLVDLAH